MPAWTIACPLGFPEIRNTIVSIFHEKLSFVVLHPLRFNRFRLLNPLMPGLLGEKVSLIAMPLTFSY